MKSITVIAGFGLLAAALTTTVEAIDRVPGDAMLAMHFHPETAEASRRATLAAAAWLENADADPAQWRQRMEAHMLVLERRAEIVPPRWAPAADGLFGWLAYSDDQNLRSNTAFAVMPGMERFGERMQGNARAGSLARAHWAAALGAPGIWERIADRLEAADGMDAQRELTAFWRLLAATAEDDRHDAHARSQAERVVELARAEAPDRRSGLRVELILEEARLSADEGRVLSSVWQSMEALIRLTRMHSPQTSARAVAGHLEALAERPTAELRGIDTQLPRVIALLQDAGGYLAADAPSVTSALRELADAYARLALFIPEASFYLDQPVRDDIRTVIAECNPDPLLVGLLPRDSFEVCLQRLIAHMADDLGREELVGDGTGPFSVAFLQREAELTSWQRANYLDGHLDWLLESGCQPPEWENLLEWSLLTQYLADWVPQRPVYFAARRWQDAVESLRDQAFQGIAEREQWRDCLSGRGGERLDTVQRLMTRHQRLLDDLAVALESAAEEHYASVTRPGADADLDGPADQRTSFRPEGIEVVPCDGGQTCGAEVTLPVSRALLGRFPNAFLLADQLRMGSIGLCYDQVRWVDRTRRSARAGDDRVANYHGRLSFELVGQFHIGDDTGTVFRQRLTAGEPRHYLFAEADDAITEQECPDSVVGDSIVSELPRSRFGLVPNRLTYFASKPVSPGSVMAANWVEGEEWRDWFVTGSRVESLESTDDERLAVAVEARLDELSARRERQLASRLLSPSTEAEAEDDALGSAMAELDSNSTLLRRLLELHYPRVIRHDDALRGLVAGESGLLTREHVRRMRDEGDAMTGVAETGRERLAMFLDHWVRLPVELREGGQVAPELDVSLEQLGRLLRLSRAWPMAGGDDESPAGQ